MTAERKLILVALAGIAIIVGLLVAISIFIFVPIQNSYATLLQANNQLALLEKKNKLLRDLELLVEQERPRIDLIDGAFLTPDKVVEFIQTLEMAAAKSQVDLIISSAEISSSPSNNESGRSRFTIVLTGDFTRVHEYITLLENVPYYIEISQATLSKLEGSRVRAEVSLSVLTAS